MSGRQNNKPTAISEEIPREEIIEAAKSFAEVRLRIRRNSARGHWATVTGSIMMPTRDLLVIDDWLREQAGGGNYRVDTTDPQDPGRTPVKPFMVRLEGPEKHFTGGPVDEAPYGSYPAQPVPHFRNAGGPTLPRNDPASPRNFMSRTPDQIASQGWDDTRRERDEERRARSQERKAHEEEQRKMRAELDLVRQQMAESAREADRRALEAKIEALQHQKPPQIDWAPIIVGVAPIVTALISASGARSQEAIAAAAARESQSLELTKTMITSRGNTEGALDQLLKVAPLVTPLITRLLDQKDPSKMADLYATVSDAQMTSASLQAQLFQMLSEGQGGDPPWMPIVTTLGEVAENMAQAMMQETGARRAHPGDPAVPQIVDAAPPGAQPAQPVAAAQPAAGPDEDPRVNAMNQVMATLPQYLQSQEWATIVYHLLGEAESAVHDIAEQILIEITKSGAPQLVAVQSDLTAIQGAFLDGLPLSPAYKQMIVQEMVRQHATPASGDGDNGSRPRPSGMLVGDEIPPEARINKGATPIN